METVKVNAIIVRELNVGESDKLITALTDSLGKITVTCKGVRSIKSKRLASAQLFSYGELLLSVRGGKYYLSDATIENSFFELNTSIEKLALAQYFCQVVGAVTVENEDQREILSLLLNSIFILCYKDKDLRLVKAVFEMRLCSLLGYCPDLFSCEYCSKEISESDLLGLCLDIGGGSLICPSCLLEEENAGIVPSGSAGSARAPLSPATVVALRYIISAHPKKIFAFQISDTELSNLAAITERYLLYHLDRGFETLDFYKSLLKDPF